MKVRIQNDGKHFYNTRFTSVETGEEMQYITEATIHFKAGEPHPMAQLIMIDPVVDVVADAQIRRICPCCERPFDEEGA